MKKNGIRVLVALLVLLAMGLVLGTAGAETVTVDYFKNGVKQSHEATVLTGSEATTKTVLASGWYVVNSNITYNGMLQFEPGEVHIILADGCTMNINNNPVDLTDSNGIQNSAINKGSTYIYGQSAGSGKIDIKSKGSGIMTYAYMQYGGQIYVYSGVARGINTTTVFTLQGGKLELSSIQPAVYASEINMYGGTLKATCRGANYETLVSTSGDIKILGGHCEVGHNDSTKKGIRSTNKDIILGWTNPTDSIYACNYILNTNGGVIKIADGQALQDESGNKYYGVLTDDQISAIAGKTLTPAHMHTFIYSANGAILTATCSSTNPACDLKDNKVTLTIVKPAKTTYGDANNESATLTGKDTFNAATAITGVTVSEDDIQYFAATKSGNTYTKTGNALPAAPVNAGDYVAEITVMGATASVGYTINPIAVTLTANSDKTAYDGKEKTVSGFISSVYGLTFADTVTASGSGTDAGEYAVTFTGVTVNETKDTTGNYMVTETVNGKLTITKAANPAVVTTTAAVKVGGNTLDLSGLIVGAPAGITYVIDGEAGGCTLEGSILKSGGSTGTCRVAVTIAESANYLGKSEIITITVTEKDTQALSFAEKTVTKTWGDVPFINALSGAKTKVTYTVTAGTEAASVAPDGTVTILTAGTATITATAEETLDIAGATASYTLTVQEAPVPPEPTPPEPQKTDIGKAKISAEDQEYTGKEIKPKLTVKLNGKKLKEKKDYTAAFKFNKEIGKATVTITGIGDYYGTATGSFLIIPKKVGSPKLTAEKGKKDALTLSWKAGKGIDGYEIEYGLKKDFKGAKKIKLKGAKNDEYEIKKLTAKKTYYVRIRAWKKAKGKMYYSAWSKTLSKKVK